MGKENGEANPRLEESKSKQLNAELRFYRQPSGLVFGGKIKWTVGFLSLGKKNTTFLNLVEEE